MTTGGGGDSRIEVRRIRGRDEEEACARRLYERLGYEVVGD